MPFAKLRDAECYYEVGGQGPLLILVTGLAGTAGFWRPNIEALEAHFTVLRYDQRGTGSSTRSEGAYSVELLAQDLVELMDRLEFSSAILLGHSTGGAIGQVIAAHHPHLVRKLVLYASWAELCPQMRICMETRQTLLRAAGIEAYHRASPVFLYPPKFTCGNIERIKGDLALNIAGSTTATILDARIDAVIDFDGRPYLHQIRAPTLVVVARDDILTPPLASHVLRQGIRGARLHEMSYGGHAASVCAPDDFHAVVLPFLHETTAQALSA